MTLDEIMQNWSEDSVMDQNNPAGEQVKVGKLHSKYFQMLNFEALRLQSMMGQQKRLTLQKTEHYMGVLPKEDLDANGWQPYKRTILKTDVPNYVAADKDVIDFNLKIAMQKQKVAALEDIIKQINNRGYAIRNIIDWAKFSNGGY